MSLLRLLPSLLLKLLTGLGVLAGVLYLSACLFLLLRQNRLMFAPSAVIEMTPDALNLRYEDVWIPVQLGDKTERMHAWWLPANGPQRGVILHLHGNGLNISANLGQALRFHELGFAVLMLDYRGYGRSEGAFPTEASFYQDAETAWSYLIQTRRTDPNQVMIYGHSLGGAIAIQLALHHPEAAGLIVQSSFTSMRAMVDLMGPYRIFPVDLLLTQHFRSIEKVKALKLPVLYIHGTADALIPYPMSEALYAETPHPKQLYLVQGGGHNDVADVGGQAYLQTLQEFLERVHTRSVSRAQL